MAAIWNIGSALTGLPQGVEAAPMPTDVPGAVQCRNWNNSWGYGGPGSSSNTYEFILYALDTNDLTPAPSQSLRDTSCFEGQFTSFVPAD